MKRVPTPFMLSSVSPATTLKTVSPTPIFTVIDCYPQPSIYIVLLSVIVPSNFKHSLSKLPSGCLHFRHRLERSIWHWSKISSTHRQRWEFFESMIVRRPCQDKKRPGDHRAEESNLKLHPNHQEKFVKRKDQNDWRQGRLLLTSSHPLALLIFSLAVTSLAKLPCRVGNDIPWHAKCGYRPVKTLSDVFVRNCKGGLSAFRPLIMVGRTCSMGEHSKGHCC